MATYDLAYPGAAIDAILNTAYFLQEAGYIFQGFASEYSGTPSKRVWLIAPAGFTGLGLSSAVPQGSFGICLYNGTAWVGKVINVLTLDSAPTRNSQNGVTSGGVAATLDEIAGGIMETFASLLFDDETASADLRTKLSYAVKFSVSDVYQTVTHLNILAATTSKAGLMSAEDKAKVDSFLTGIRSMQFVDATSSSEQAIKLVEQLKWTVGGVQEVIDSITLLAATSSKAGLLSASDKAYIDALPATLTSLSNSISGALALMQSLVGYYVCDTAAGTAAKTVAATGYSLTNGGCIRIKMANANTAANVTLNINSTGAKSLYYDGAQASATNTWEAGEVLEVYYDGTQYQCASGGGGKFASGQKVKEISLLNNLDGSGNIPKSSAVMNYLEPLTVYSPTDVVYPSETVGVQISNGKWVSQPQRHIYLIPYTYHDGDKMRIKGHASNGSYYAFLTSASHSVGDDVPFCIQGQTDWTNVAAGVSVDVAIPSNCACIAINKSYGTSSSSTFTPQELMLPAKSLADLDDILDAMDDIHDEIDDIHDEIEENKTYIEQLGAACENQEASTEETLYGEVGTWNTNGNIDTATTIRAHLKIPAIGVNAMSITVPSGYYANIYYVNASNVMQSAVLVDWQGVGTVNLELNGAFDLMLNIKYGSAGTTNITSDMLASAPFVVTKSVMFGYNPAAPLSELEDLKDDIAPILSKPKDYDSWDNSGNAGNIRVRFIYTNIAGAKVKVSANSGYSFGISVYSATTPTGTAVYDTGWRTGTVEYTVPSTGIGCMTINTAKGSGRTQQITFADSTANILKEVLLGTRSVIDNAIKDSQDIITSGAVYASMYGKGSHHYSGQRVVLASYNFQGLEFMTVAAPSGTGQGAGVYGDYFVQGGAGGHVRVYDLITKAVVANSVNLAVVNSTNHVNNICFSKLFPSDNTDFPYMYVSECTGQGRCFVENFTLSGSTLVQTLSYSGTDLHDTNWVLDYDRGYIYLLGNTESSYTVANNKVRVKKFALPLPTAGDVVFTPEDVLDTFDMDGSDGQARVFQGNIISNGKMYSCFGGSQTTHRIWINDLDTHELLTVIELDQMYTGECESINIWNNSLLIGYPNQSKLYQLTF